MNGRSVTELTSLVAMRSYVDSDNLVSQRLYDSSSPDNAFNDPLSSKVPICFTTADNERHVAAAHLIFFGAMP